MSVTDTRFGEPILESEAVLITRTGAEVLNLAPMRLIELY